jgi:hypothetical protein
MKIALTKVKERYFIAVFDVRPPDYVGLVTVSDSRTIKDAMNKLFECIAEVKRII